MDLPSYIYIVSGDPMHFSHLNTKCTAEKELGQKVSLVVGINKMKDGGLFSLEERKKIAQLYLPNEEIFTIADISDALKYIRGATRVVRGFKNDQDYKYLEKLLEKYNCSEQINKLISIQIPPDFTEISSTNLKNKILDGSYNQKEMVWVSNDVYHITKNKLFL